MGEGEEREERKERADEGRAAMVTGTVEGRRGGPREVGDGMSDELTCAGC